MNNKLFYLDDIEKSRILNLHKNRTKTQYLKSQENIYESLSNKGKVIITERQILSSLFKKGSSLADDIISKYGDDFATKLSKTLSNPKNVINVGGSNVLVSASGKQIPMSQIEDALKLISSGKLSADEVAALLPKQLADGTEFRSLIVNAKPSAGTTSTALVSSAGKTSTASASSAGKTSTALTIIPIEQLDEPAKKIANNIVVQYSDDVAKAKQLLPASGKNIDSKNRKFFVDFFGNAKLITDVGGRKFFSKRNLFIAAAILGISWLVLKNTMEQSGVEVESDTVDTTSCLGKLENSTNHPGKQYYKEINEFKGGTTTDLTYYTTGAFYEIRLFSNGNKYTYPKGSNTYFRFYCSGNEIVKTKEIVGIDGKPLGTTTPKSGDESPVTGGDSYTGGYRWRSLGPSYDKQILQALGKNEDRRLTDDDIKELYNKLKSAGKIN